MQRREKVALELGDDWSEGMRRAQEASRRLTRAFARMDATWEPIDWSDFD